MRSADFISHPHQQLCRENGFAPIFYLGYHHHRSYYWYRLHTGPARDPDSYCINNDYGAGITGSNLRSLTNSDKGRDGRFRERGRCLLLTEREGKSTRGVFQPEGFVFPWRAVHLRV